ncbi:phage tail protein [Xanthomonas hortorum]|uniref:Phage tail protein n=1 Tax=Xanthomonas hortorum pv. pelargonii TaxID=453602 RepID=A0A6V7F8M2_9XANT|nr:tail fiber protein [Xanthomonas hortorum]MCE4355003.1 tail fiber protein [Xanthomonas hortorum pv. pelargonii]MCM5522949.1 tail fiber protein [Xanthomonas hortorum pv. pelargonii]MCM5535164.1 tail fiber protein [Xanthomonas hortorum pv. pelargonii]MCM5539293.1 tail fiber protein [Xanthomonas hortorum pv. pelargonii]MCM5543443.1 tail fiber protein [Xanthomonas hortorum pv. pelargonii]
MSELFVGQIMMAGFSFAPKYFAQCNGQLLPVQQNQALFSLLGTRYGGNGSATFGLPDMRGRTPVGYGPSVDPAWQPAASPIGALAGSENVTLLQANLPSHTHLMDVSSAAGNSRSPAGRVLANNTSGAATPLYAAAGTLVSTSPGTVAPTGGNQSHPNLQPYNTLNFCIALSGYFPSRG